MVFIAPTPIFFTWEKICSAKLYFMVSISVNTFYINGRSFFKKMVKNVLWKVLSKHHCTKDWLCASNLTDLFCLRPTVPFGYMGKKIKNLKAISFWKEDLLHLLKNISWPFWAVVICKENRLESLILEEGNIIITAWNLLTGLSKWGKH